MSENGCRVSAMRAYPSGVRRSDSLMTIPERDARSHAIARHRASGRHLDLRAVPHRLDSRPAEPIPPRRLAIDPTVGEPAVCVDRARQRNLPSIGTRLRRIHRTRPSHERHFILPPCPRRDGLWNRSDQKAAGENKTDDHRPYSQATDRRSLTIIETSNQRVERYRLKPHRPAARSSSALRMVIFCQILRPRSVHRLSTSLTAATTCGSCVRAAYSAASLPIRASISAQ